MNTGMYLKFGKNTRISMVAAPFVLVSMNAVASDFTAGVVMQKMETKERYAFMAGIVEGLAMARYMKDGKEPEGMKCIYDWFYEGTGTLKTIDAAFEKYPSYPPGSIVDVLVKQKCGE